MFLFLFHHCIVSIIKWCAVHDIVSRIAVYQKLTLNFFILSLGFIVVPQIIDYNLGNNKGENPNFKDVVVSLITGQGWIDKNTTMFYGQYGFPNETLQIPNDYSMSGAYFYTNLIIFVGTLLYISVT